MRTSYGVICYRRCETTPPGCLYLLVQRKDSISYVEFLRGKYDTCDDVYISKLLAGMTPQERDALISGRPFSQLWAGVWADRRRAPAGYQSAAAKFGQLRPRLPELLEHSSARAEPEWGFPKGGKRRDESASAAALREFSEETGVSAVRMSNTTIVDTFVGTDGNKYQHVFFLADTTDGLTDEGKYDTTEIGDVRWFSYDQALAKLARPGPLVRAAARVQPHTTMTS